MQIGRQLLCEIRALYPQIALSTYTEAYTYTSSDNASRKLPIVLLGIEPRKSVPVADREKLTGWLQLRLNVHLNKAIPLLDSLGFKGTLYIPGTVSKKEHLPIPAAKCTPVTNRFMTWLKVNLTPPVVAPGLETAGIADAFNLRAFMISGQTGDEMIGLVKQFWPLITKLTPAAHSCRNFSINQQLLMVYLSVAMEPDKV